MRMSGFARAGAGTSCKPTTKVQRFFHISKTIVIFNIILTYKLKVLICLHNSNIIITFAYVNNKQKEIMITDETKSYLETAHKTLQLALSHATKDGDREAIEEIQTASNIIRGLY